MAILNNKSIVIVGGTSGLGLAAAAACHAAGAKLILVGRDPEKCRQAADRLPGSCEIAGDAANEQTARDAVAAAVSRFGRLDGLYHVAGGSGRRQGDGPLHEISAAGWQYTLQTNLTALFYSNQAAVQQMMAQGGGGAILNMSSVLGFSPSAKYFATHAYAAAKAAAIGLSKSMAAYYAPHNIRVNVLAPALFETPMAQRALGDEATMQYIRHKQPLDGGRPGLPTDADHAAAFLLSDHARFITGQVLAIDGGWTVSEA